MPRCPLCRHHNPLPLAQVNGRTYWSCEVCRLAFLSPEQRPDADTELRRYRQHQNSPEDQGYRKFLGRLMTHLTPRLPPGAYGPDYGSGPGPTLSVMLEERGFPMSIYDPYFAPDVSVLQCTYDFITCTETAEHFYNPAPEFRRLYLMINEGGWLGVMTEMLEPDQPFVNWWYHRDPTHVCFYRRETMEWLSGRFGWEVIFPGKNVTLFRKPKNHDPGYLDVTYREVIYQARSNCIFW